MSGAPICTVENMMLDRKGFGLKPGWPDRLILLIDLERAAVSRPRFRFVAQGLTEGYPSRFIAASMGLHHKQVQREIAAIQMIVTGWIDE